MGSGGSITYWLDLLKEGHRDAAQPLWEAYFQRLVALAHARLCAAARHTGDEEDVALSAFASFCRRAEQGQFPRLADRDDLWQVLFVLTVRKAVDHARHEGRQSRGAGRVRSLADPDAEQVLDPEPTPELAAQLADESQRLLARLRDDTLRSVALWKLEGYTNAEIAAKLGCVPLTVRRKLRAIRRLWTGEPSP